MTKAVKRKKKANIGAKSNVAKQKRKETFSAAEEKHWMSMDFPLLKE